MILHLSPGSGSIELHIHDDAQSRSVSARRTARPAEASTTSFSRQPSRLVVGW